VQVAGKNGTINVITTSPSASPPMSPSPLVRLEGLAATYDRYFNLYVIYIDYFHYMQSLSHEH